MIKKQWKVTCDEPGCTSTWFCDAKGVSKRDIKTIIQNWDWRDVSDIAMDINIRIACPYCQSQY